MPLSPSTSAVAGPVRFTSIDGVGFTAASLQPADILRQPEDAVRIGPDQVGLDHQPGDHAGIAVRQPRRHQGAAGEIHEKLGWHRHVVTRGVRRRHLHLMISEPCHAILVPPGAPSFASFLRMKRQRGLTDAPRPPKRSPEEKTPCCTARLAF